MDTTQILRWTRIGMAMQGINARQMADRLGVHESIFSRIMAGAKISKAVLAKMEDFAKDARENAIAELKLRQDAQE